MNFLISSLVALAHPVQVHTDCLIRTGQAMEAQGSSSMDYASAIPGACQQTRDALMAYQVPRMKPGVEDPAALVWIMIAELEAEAVRSYAARTGR